MEIIICEKIQRITKNKAKLEKVLGVKITNRGKEVAVTGPAENEYFAEKAITALDFGFPFSIALLLEDEDAMLEILNIKDYTHKKDLEKIRARLIGTKGRTLRTLNELTKCYFEVKDNQVAVIGHPEYIKNAQEAVISLIQGSKWANVYAFLEKHQVKPILDLGLKEVKKKKR